MKLSQYFLATLSCLIIAGSASSQDTTPEAETVPVPAAQAFPVAKEPAAEPFIKSTHGSWDVRCQNAQSTESCTMYMLLKDANDNPTAEINIVSLPQGQEAMAGVTLVTPLATLLPRGIAYSIDSDRARRYEFSWCDRGGCVSRFGFTGQEIGFMEKGKMGKLTIVAVADPANPLTLNLPLDGFKAAWEALVASAP